MKYIKFAEFTLLNELYKSELTINWAKSSMTSLEVEYW